MHTERDNIKMDLRWDKEEIGLNSSGSVRRRWAVIRMVTKLWVAYNGEIIRLGQQIDTLVHAVG